MSTTGCPRLGPDSVLLVVREGGFVVTPGLSQPRRIDIRALSERQRSKLQTVLEDIETLSSGHRDAAPSSAGTADGRYFRITVEIASGRSDWERELDEASAPRSLIGLWKRGPKVLDDSDD